MEFDVYKAPQGYAYELDGELSYVVILLKGSDLINSYTLVKINQTKENE